MTTFDLPTYEPESPTFADIPLFNLPSLIDAHDDALALMAERDAEIEGLKAERDAAHEALRAAKALLIAIDAGGQYPHSGFMIGIVLFQITQIVG